MTPAAITRRLKKVKMSDEMQKSRELKHHLDLHMVRAAHSKA